MGSDSDLPVMQSAVNVLGDLGIAHEVRVTSAHRTPEEMIQYGKDAADRGIKVIIAGAGGAAHLPGMLASVTILPVIGVPVRTTAPKGVDTASARIAACSNGTLSGTRVKPMTCATVYSAQAPS